MDHLCHQFLAGAALAVDQHRQVGGRGFLGDFQRVEQFEVVAEHAFEDEAAAKQCLAALSRRLALDRQFRRSGFHEAFLVRHLHYFVAQGARLSQEFFNFLPLQLRRPA